MSRGQARLDEPAVARRLERWAIDQYGPDSQIESLRPMPGNAGISFGFSLATPQGVDKLVVRLPPAGAALKGNADMLRQVTVLRVMEECGVSVPAVRYAAAENPWFDTPFYLASFVRGRSTHLFDAQAALDDGSGMEDVFGAAIRELAAIHRVDWRAFLPDWADPRPLPLEIDAWQPTLMKSSNDDWKRHGLQVRDRLLRTMPPEPDLAVVHGDFYSNNWLFDGAEVTAIVDWEISGIGAPGLDVGWLCMMYDPESWGSARHVWQRWNPTPAFIADQYAGALGRAVADLDWYRALAGYRLGCITARNYTLHTTGKRIDPAWEIIADALPHMFDRALELCAGSARR